MLTIEETLHVMDVMVQVEKSKPVRLVTVLGIYNKFLVMLFLDKFKPLFVQHVMEQDKKS